MTSPRTRDETAALENKAYVMITNFSEESLTIPKSTIIGVAEPVSEAWVNHINTGEIPKSSVTTKHKEEAKNEALYQKLLKGKLNHLPRKERQLLEPVMWKYAHPFHDEETNDFRATDVVEHQTEVEDTKPIRRPQYKTPFALRGEMKAQVENMLAKGLSENLLHRGRRPPYWSLRGPRTGNSNTGSAWTSGF